MFWIVTITIICVYPQQYYLPLTQTVFTTSNFQFYVLAEIFFYLLIHIIMIHMINDSYYYDSKSITILFILKFLWNFRQTNKQTFMNESYKKQNTYHLIQEE